MTEDLDIYRSAHLYIREHGDDAAIEAANMIDAMFDGINAGVEAALGLSRLAAREPSRERDRPS